MVNVNVSPCKYVSHFYPLVVILLKKQQSTTKIMVKNKNYYIFLLFFFFMRVYINFFQALIRMRI